MTRKSLTRVKPEAGFSAMIVRNGRTATGRGSGAAAATRGGAARSGELRPRMLVGARHRDAHLLGLSDGRLRLEGQEGGRLRVPRLHEPRVPAPLLRG